MAVKYQPVDCIMSSNSPDDNVKPLKVVAVGNSNVGITSMLVTYLLKKFPDEVRSTIIDEYTAKTCVENKEYDVCFWNISCRDGFDKLRILNYNNVNCVLVCFSVTDRTSFESITSRWHPEIEEHCQKVPKILIGNSGGFGSLAKGGPKLFGTKSDLRMRHDDCVTSEEADELKELIGAVEYIECSALADENLDTIFEEAVQVCLSSKQKANCIIV